MGPHKSIVAILFINCLAFGSWQVQASDPELSIDFAVPTCVNVSTLYGNFLYIYRSAQCLSKPMEFCHIHSTLVNVGKFPALADLGVSLALLQFPAGAINVPCTHPCGIKHLLVVQWTLDVGLIDTTNKLFTQTLMTSDSFVFPKGLVHFQINNDPSIQVTAIVAFSSSNLRLVRLPNTLFKSNIADYMLAKASGVKLISSPS